MLGELAIDYDRRLVMVAGREVGFAPSEHELLRILSVNAGRVTTSGLLLRQFWVRREDANVQAVRNFVKGKKGRGGRGGGSGPVSRTDPDARLARKSARAGFEPSYKRHAVVDDERGVVLDVAVTAGTLNEREMMEPQLDAVCELTGRAPAVVTADSGYAYSKVYGALERRGVAALIPAKREPSQSRVPLQLFRYDARNEVVKCPGGETPREPPKRPLQNGVFQQARQGGSELPSRRAPRSLPRVGIK